MKVLYIGYYKEKSDWGRYATSNILALEKAGLDVVCRAISFSGNETPREISHLEDKSLDDCDVCIQHVFPEHLVGTDKFEKNIAIFGNEFVTLDHSSWAEQLNQLDQIWVASEVAKDSMPKEIKDKTVVVPHCFDKSLYTKNYKEIQVPELTGKFKFYTVVDAYDDQTETILRCFHSEFDKDDNVALILQLVGRETQESLDVKKHELKKKISNQEDLSDCLLDMVVQRGQDPESIYQLHQYGDCFVTPSNQRCLPSSVFDALCLGSVPVVLEGTDAPEYADEAVIKSVYRTIERSDSMWKDVYNAKNFVFTPCEMGMRQTMRQLYNDWLKDPMIHIQKRKQGLEKAEKFSQESFGNTVKEVLNA